MAFKHTRVSMVISVLSLLTIGCSSKSDDPAKWHEGAGAKPPETKLPYFSTLDGFESLDEEKDLTFLDLTALAASKGRLERSSLGIILDRRFARKGQEFV